MKREQHMISIIIPVHNAGKTLRNAAGSVAAQSILRLREDVQLELILVDDGSTDESGELCDSYLSWNENEGSVRVKVIHMEDEGVSEARNRGLDAASGDLITFLDADDALDSEMLERLWDLHEETGAKICGCGFASVMPEEAAEYGEQLLYEKANEDSKREREAASERVSGKASVKVQKKEPVILSGTDIVKDGILQGDTRVWSKLFTKEVIGEKRFLKGLSIGEDMLFVISLIGENTSYAAISDALYRYTVNPKGAMERPFTLSYMDQLRCYEEAERVIKRNLPQLCQDPVARARLRRLQVIADVLTAMKMARLPQKELKQYGKEFYQCRMLLRRHLKEPGIASVIPKDYRLKSFMLIYLPTVFKALVRAKETLIKSAFP